MEGGSRIYLADILKQAGRLDDAEREARAAVATAEKLPPLRAYAMGTLARILSAKGATVVQVHGVGPFVVNYVNPADDPSKQ